MLTESDKQFFYMQQRIAQGAEARDTQMYFLALQAIQHDIDSKELALDSDIWSEDARQRIKTERDLLQEAKTRLFIR